MFTETGEYVECYTSTGTGFGNIRKQTLKQLLSARRKGTDFDSPCPIKDRLYIKLVRKEEMQHMRSGA